MDERFPCVPMLKWDHMMESQPMFASVLPDTTSNNACKMLLGAPKSQEVMLFQYKGDIHICNLFIGVFLDNKCLIVNYEHNAKCHDFKCLNVDGEKLRKQTIFHTYIL